jgi:glycosyltransferase involved in cell wall biosynthesis
VNALDAHADDRIVLNVIIPVWNDWAGLVSTLSALEQQTLDRALWSVTVVDNGSDVDATGEIALANNVRVVHEPKPGSYAARNAGIRATSAEYLAFTDAGCEPHDDWLRAGLAALKQSDCRVAGDIRVFAAGDAPTMAELHELLYGFGQAGKVVRGVAATANLFVARWHFGEVGLFDERLWSGGDLEWNRRATRAGIPIVFSHQAVVRHPARSTLDELLRKDARVWSGKLAFRDYPPVLLGLVAVQRGLIAPVLAGPSIVLGRHRALVGVRVQRRILFALWLHFARWRMLAQRLKIMARPQGRSSRRRA